MANAAAALERAQLSGLAVTEGSWAAATVSVCARKPSPHHASLMQHTQRLLVPSQTCACLFGLPFRKLW